MFKKIKNLYYRLISILQTQAELSHRLEEIQFLQGAILAELAASRFGGKPLDFEYKVFSQWGEDGIIQKIVRHIDIPNKSFVEFGVQDFRESNCRFLMMNNNWRGLVIDSNQKDIANIRKSPTSWRHHLEAVCEFVNRDNINELIEGAGLAGDIGILSIDIDGVDYWILESIKCCSPRVLIVEYNSIFGRDRAISVPYDPDFNRSEKHFSNLYFGASLAAFHHLASQRGYSLIGTNSIGSNAFFIRNDQLSKCPFPVVTVAEAYLSSSVRESRDRLGNLTFLSGEARLNIIKGMTVINVIQGNSELI